MLFNEVSTDRLEHSLSNTIAWIDDMAQQIRALESSLSQRQEEMEMLTAEIQARRIIADLCPLYSA